MAVRRRIIRMGKKKTLVLARAKESLAPGNRRVDSTMSATYSIEIRCEDDASVDVFLRQDAFLGKEIDCGLSMSVISRGPRQPIELERKSLPFDIGKSRARPSKFNDLVDKQMSRKTSPFLSFVRDK